jgi:hypothetical protein
MPLAVSYPGVYIEEVPNGVRTITGVAVENSKRRIDQAELDELGRNK